jgi:hypothetical protein
VALLLKMCMLRAVVCAAARRRPRWLHAMAFPEPGEVPDDESDDDEGWEVRLTVRRQHLLEDSYAQVRRAAPQMKGSCRTACPVMRNL